MKTKGGIALSVFFSLFVFSHSYAQVEKKSLLVLGDSHMKGYFGEFFHKRLHNEGKYFILSIGIGGAGTKTFVSNLKNTCCGYRVRYTSPDRKIGEKEWIPVLESAEAPTNANILKVYGSYLISVLKLFKPDVVIIALGSNYYNAHQELLNIIDTYKPSLPFVWVGPFNRLNVDVRYRAIERALENKPNGILVRSDDIVGNDTLAHAHYVGKTARYWAYTVVERMKPFLDSVLVD